MKKNKTIHIFFFFIALFVFNINTVFAAKEGIGIKIYIQNEKGNTIESANVLRKTTPEYPSAYRVYSGLPYFNADNASTVLTEHFNIESNVASLLASSGLKTTLAQLKLNKYKLVIDGIYGYQITEYRYRDKTTKTVDCNCSYRGTGGYDYHYECGCSRRFVCTSTKKGGCPGDGYWVRTCGSCCHEAKEWVCSKCQETVWSNWSN